VPTKRNSEDGFTYLRTRSCDDGDAVFTLNMLKIKGEEEFKMGQTATLENLPASK